MVVAFALFGLSFVLTGAWVIGAQSRYLDRVRPLASDGLVESIAGLLSRRRTDGRLLETPQQDPELEALRQRAVLAFRWAAIWVPFGGFPTLVLGGWIDQRFSGPSTGLGPLLWALLSVLGLVSVALGIRRLRRPEVRGLDRLVSAGAVVLGLGSTVLFAVLAVWH